MYIRTLYVHWIVQVYIFQVAASYDHQVLIFEPTPLLHHTSTHVSALTVHLANEATADLSPTNNGIEGNVIIYYRLLVYY